jgi:two-component system chemotaxis response regulator CheB
MDDPRAHPPLVVIGGSAGALRPLRRIIASLPPTLEAAIGVVIHVPDDSPSALARVLATAGRLPASFAEDGQRVEAGTIAVAPPGHHLLVNDGRLTLSRGARENGTRPAIDPLFRSAARSRGPGAVAVLLSGTLDDGMAGVAEVRRSGGVTLAQDPAEAEFPDMPRNAIASGSVDEVLSSTSLGPRIVELVAERRHLAPSHAGPGLAGDADLAGDARTVDRGLAGRAEDLPGAGSPYSCPACGGVLYDFGREGGYVCRLGHRYSPDALRAGQEGIIEDALWTALRTLDEAASLAERVRDRATARGDRGMELRFEARRAGAQARADRIRAVLRGETARGVDELIDAVDQASSDDAGRGQPQG